MKNLLSRFFGLLLLFTASLTFAAAGPPLLTDDPDTPGDNNWEINVATTTEHTHDESSYETPLLDINYGVGDRIQLKYEVPYVVEKTQDAPTRSALGNSLLGVKWRFYDDAQNSGLSVSTYPQLELNTSKYARTHGLVDDTPNYLLPIEINRAFENFELGVEAGHWFTHKMPASNILGLSATRQITPAFEALGEIYNTWTQSEKRETLLDLGGRYTLRDHMLLLFMAGHSIGNAPAAEWVGYLALQFQIERTRD